MYNYKKYLKNCKKTIYDTAPPVFIILHAFAVVTELSLREPVKNKVADWPDVLKVKNCDLPEPANNVSVPKSNLINYQSI